MPHYLFKPLARKQPTLTFKAVAALADAFTASQTATAIRLIEADLFPGFVVCHGPQGRKWFARSPSVPRKWFPQDALDPESYAIGVLFGGAADDTMPRKIDADAWFDRWDADRFQVLEQTMRTGPKETLTLIGIIDGKMLDDDNGGRKAWR